MKKTINFLMATVILLPLLAYFLGAPPNEIQLRIVKETAWILAVVIGYTFIVGQMTGNNSQVDKLWSIVPIIYVWHMTSRGGWDSRIILQEEVLIHGGSGRGKKTIDGKFLERSLDSRTHLCGQFLIFCLSAFIKMPSYSYLQSL
jgi:hypothetical protein